MIRSYKHDETMWFNVNTGEKDENGRFTYKRIDVQEVIPEVPKSMWTTTRSGKSETVQLQRDKFDIIEEEVEYTIDPIVTSKGTVLSEGREGVKTIFRLIEKK